MKNIKHIMKTKKTTRGIRIHKSKRTSFIHKLKYPLGFYNDGIQKGRKAISKYKKYINFVNKKFIQFFITRKSIKNDTSYRRFSALWIHKLKLKKLIRVINHFIAQIRFKKKKKKIRKKKYQIKNSKLQNIKRPVYGSSLEKGSRILPFEKYIWIRAQSYFFGINLRKTSLIRSRKNSNQSKFSGKRRFIIKSIKEIFWFNIKLLDKFIGWRAQIIPRRVTKVTLKQQRFLTREIKKARFLALLPYDKNELYRKKKREERRIRKELYKLKKSRKSRRTGKRFHSRKSKDK